MARDTVTETTLRLSDRSEVELSAEALQKRGRELLARAQTDLQTSDDPTRLRVLIDGHPLDVMPLVATTLGVETDQLRLSPTVHALRLLGFTLEDFEPIEDRRRVHEDRQHPRSGDANNDPAQTQPSNAEVNVDEVTDVDAGDVVTPFMSPDLANSLQRHAGQWVAIRDNALVGHAETLKELRDTVGPGKISVLFVPRPSPSTGE